MIGLSASRLVVAAAAGMIAHAHVFAVTPEPPRVRVGEMTSQDKCASVQCMCNCHVQRRMKKQTTLGCFVPATLPRARAFIEACRCLDSRPSKLHSTLWLWRKELPTGTVEKRFLEAQVVELPVHRDAPTGVRRAMAMVWVNIRVRWSGPWP